MNLPEKTLGALFVSKVRLKALTYFMLHPNKEIHLRGAVRELQEEINAVRRELSRMEKVDLLVSESKGNRKYFSLNLAHVYINELMSMFHKSYGLGGDIIKNQKALGNVEFALLTPSYTKGIHFGSQVVDLLVVGDVKMQILQNFIDEAEEVIGREINYSMLRSKELDMRRRRRDQFITDIMLQDNVMLIGRHEDFIR